MHLFMNLPITFLHAALKMALACSLTFSLGSDIVRGMLAYTHRSHQKYELGGLTAEVMEMKGPFKMSLLTDKTLFEMILEQFLNKFEVWKLATSCWNQHSESAYR